MTGSLASVHPELIPEWSEKNLPLTPDKITFGSNKRVWWKGACGHEWETSVKARSKGEKCPICSGARVIEGINDLVTLKPLLAQEWSEKNKLKPTELSVASHKKIIWKCKHGHEWEASVKSRTINGTGCPYCSHNKVLAGFNDLASQYPDIAAEWSDRNLPLLPTMVTAFANSIRSVTVQAINLVPQDTPRQIDMFMDAAKQDKLERMEKCVEEIRRRFGKDSIRNGVLCQNLRLPPKKAEITMPTGMVG